MRVNNACGLGSWEAGSWYRAVLRAVAVIMVAIVVVHCAAPEKDQILTGPRWIDLVLSAGSEISAGINHDDEFFVGIPLTREESLVELKAEVNRPRSLILGGGFDSSLVEKDQEAVLRYQVFSQGAVVFKGRIRLDVDDRWWSRKVQLPDDLVGPVDLRLKAKLGNGQRILVKDLLIEQQMADPSAAIDGPQILLISVDTLREDALGAFGGSGITPNLDQLAAEGERWSPHYSGGGWTKPSHAVMLTGYRGDTHLMYEEERVMDAGLPTLAQRLQASGLRTAGFVFDCKWLDPKWGFGRGFDEYHVQDSRVGRTIFEIENWIESNRESPFFLFYHTFEPHSDWARLPYESPRTTQETVAERFGVEGYGCEGDRCASQWMNDLNNGVVEPRENEAEILRFLYQRGVSETDRALGELFENLKERGLWDQMLIIVTSDHGEAFFEHGRCLHGLVWNEIIRVPMIIKWPDRHKAGGLGTFPSSSIDIAPTLLRFAGVEHDDLPGKPLQILNEDRPMTIGGGNRMIIRGDWKVVVGGDLTTVKFTSSVSQDPWETNDRTLDQEPIVEELLQVAREITKSDRALRQQFHDPEGPDQAALTDEETAKLKALGYLD